MSRAFPTGRDRLQHRRRRARRLVELLRSPQNQAEAALPRRAAGTTMRRAHARLPVACGGSGAGRASAAANRHARRRPPRRRRSAGGDRWSMQGDLGATLASRSSTASTSVSLARAQALGLSVDRGFRQLHLFARGEANAWRDRRDDGTDDFVLTLDLGVGARLRLWRRPPEIQPGGGGDAAGAPRRRRHGGHGRRVRRHPAAGVCLAAGAGRAARRPSAVADAGHPGSDRHSPGVDPVPHDDLRGARRFEAPTFGPGAHAATLALLVAAGLAFAGRAPPARSRSPAAFRIPATSAWGLPRWRCSSRTCPSMVSSFPPAGSGETSPRSSPPCSSTAPGSTAATTLTDAQKFLLFSVVVGIRSPDTGGHSVANLDDLRREQIDPSPDSQHLHCLRAPAEDGFAGDTSVLRGSEALIRQELSEAAAAVGRGSSIRPRPSTSISTASWRSRSIRRRT